MRRKINIALGIILVSGLIVAAVTDPWDRMLVEGFSGIMGDRAPSKTLSTVRELVNADIIVRGGQSIVKQRAGFTKLGGLGLDEYPVQGIFRYDPATGDDQIIIASGSKLFAYNAQSDTMIPWTSNPLATNCACTSGVVHLWGLGGSQWWEISFRAFDSIYIWDDSSSARIAAPIKAMYRDGYITMSDAWIGSTYASTPCTLRGTYTPPTGDLFDNPNNVKRGLMFGDSLIVVSSDNRVFYGASGQVFLSSPVMDMSDEGLQYQEWQGSHQYVLKVTPTPEQVLDWSLNDWIWIYDHEGDTTVNLALNYFKNAGNVVSMAAPPRLCDILRSTSNDAGSIYRKIETPTWDTLTIGIIQSVTVESTSAYHSYYLYTYTVDSLTDSLSPHNWALDSLNYMTTVSEEANVPYYPVLMGVYNNDTCFIVTDVCLQTEHKHLAGDSLILRQMLRSSTTLDANVVSSESWDSPVQMLLNNRLYYAKENSSELWYCDEFVKCAYAAADGNLFVNQGDGDVITAALVYGRNGVIFKKRHIYIAIVSAYDNEIDEVIMANSPTGAPSQEAVLDYGGLIYFISPPHGLFAFDGNRATNISGASKFYWADSVEAGTEPAMRMIAFTDPTIGTAALYISYTSVDGTENDRTMRYDLETRQWSKYTNFGASAFAIMRGGSGYGDSLLIGTPVDDDSYVLKFPSGTKDTAEFIEMQILTGFDNFGSLLHNKMWTEYVPVYSSAADGSLRVYHYTDWSSTATFVDSFSSSAGWQAPRRGLNVQGKSYGFMVESKKAESVEVLGVEVFFKDIGRADD